MATATNPSAVIGSGGRITVPAEVWDRLGLKEGDQVAFVLEDNGTVLRPVKSDVNPFEKYVGALPAFANIAEVNAWVRELRGGEDDEASAA